jgi:hypothetical protein
MVKLKNSDIGFTAIYTRMRREISVQSLFIFRVHASVTFNCAVKVDLLVILVVRLISFCLAKPAPALPRTILFVSPREIFFCVSLFAAAWTNFLHETIYRSELKTEKMTPPTVSFVCLNSMAVSASDFAFSNFGFNGRPGEALTNHPGNII